MLISYCYRPLSSMADGINRIENETDKCSSEQRETILLGNFNFNLLHDTQSSKTWLRTINAFNCHQLIKTPVRVTNASQTLIDHLYSSVPENIIEITVPHLAVSDQYPICFIRQTSSYPTGPVHKTINYRDTKNFNEIAFLNDLHLPWFLIYEAETVTYVSFSCYLE